jgi:hypothetical protein
LKSLIDAAGFVVDYTLTKTDLDTLGRHDLDKLWKLARPLLNPACELGGDPGVPLDDLEALTGRGFAIRQPKQKIANRGCLPCQIWNISTFGTSRLRWKNSRA